MLEFINVLTDTIQLDFQAHVNLLQSLLGSRMMEETISLMKHPFAIDAEHVAPRILIPMCQIIMAVLPIGSAKLKDLQLVDSRLLISFSILSFHCSDIGCSTFNF